MLKVNQIIINSTKRFEEKSIINSIKAKIWCKNNLLSSPKKWKLSSRFYLEDSGVYDINLNTEEKVVAVANNDILEVEMGRNTFNRKVSNNFTSDWCLFDAIQRLPFRKKENYEFDLLEGLTLFKEGHHLSYQGKFKEKFGKQFVYLHRFHQLGNGILPFEYWLDDSHRLVLITTGSRAYIAHSPKNISNEFSELEGTNLGN